MTRSRKIKYFQPEEIVIPSKMNELTLGELEYLFPYSGQPPLLPNGMNFRANRNTYESMRVVNGERLYAGYSSDFQTALKALEEFCKKHNLKL